MAGVYFGDKWDAPVTDGATQVETPVGTPCLLCSDPIRRGDQGTMSTAVRGRSGNTVAEIHPIHRECQLRSVLGSIGHLLKKCSCYGGEVEDVEGLTDRENALLVWAWFITYGVR